MIDHESLITGHSSLAFYVVGGTLLGESPCYVVRRADHELQAAHARVTRQLTPDERLKYLNESPGEPDAR